MIRAVSPSYGVQLFVDEPAKAFLALGSIFLVVTGGEALYADMGHFGRRPIQLSWYTIVFPALLLNYFGQAALLASSPGEEVGTAVLPPGAGLGDHAAGRVGDDGHGDRLAGADLRRLLADSPGGPARLPAAPRHPPHVLRPHRADLRAARQLAADDRLRRAGHRLPDLEQPRRGIRHRGHGDDGDHDVALLPSRPSIAGAGRPRRRSR